MSNVSETWIEDFTNLLKFFESEEKHFNPANATKIRNFYRSFAAGSKQFRVLPQLTKIYQQLNLPQQVFKSEQVEQVEQVEVEQVEVEQVEVEQVEVEQVEVEQVEVEQVEVETVISPLNLDQQEEVISVVNLDDTESTEEVAEELDLTWVENFNSESFLIKSGPKSLRLHIARVTPEYQNNLLRLFRNFDDRIEYIMPAIKPTNLVSQKKMKKALKHMNKMDKKQLQKIKQTIPPKQLEEMSNDPNMRELASTLSRNESAQKVAEQLS